MGHGHDTGTPQNAAKRTKATVRIDPIDAPTRALWNAALDLSGKLPAHGWALVGGLMVQLHASRYEQAGSRPTEDIDILANSRQRPQSMTELIAERLVELGYEVAKRTGGITTPTTVFRFECDGEVVDVLAPDGLGDVPPRTLGTGETLQIPGGTQALHRTETVMVEVEGGRSGAMRCPSLSAALLLKARSIQTAHRDQDRQDLVVLLSCVDDPIAVRGQLKPSELRWLRRAAKRLRIDAPDLSDIFSGEQLARARAAYKLLSGT